MRCITALHATQNINLWDEKARQRGEEKPLKENDHAMDALRYLCHTRTNRFRR